MQSNVYALRRVKVERCTVGCCLYGVSGAGPGVVAAQNDGDARTNSRRRDVTRCIRALVSGLPVRYLCFRS